MGCAKYQAWLSFDNGEKWLVQIPRTGNSEVPSELVEYLIASEYATLRFLEPMKIPAPRAFIYGLASDPCKPYQEGLSTAHKVSPSQKVKVLEQVAEIMLEIHEHPVPSAGSPVVDNGQIQISTLAKDRFVGLSTSGPCTTPLEYILTITGQYMDLIADGQLHHTHPLEACLFYHYFHHNGAAIVAAYMQGSFFSNMSMTKAIICSSTRSSMSSVSLAGNLPVPCLHLKLLGRPTLLRISHQCIHVMAASPMMIDYLRTLLGKGAHLILLHMPRGRTLCAGCIMA